MNSTNARRHGPDLHINDNDLITGRDARRLVEAAWEARRPLVDRLIAEAITAERERAWWRRLMRWTVRHSPAKASSDVSDALREAQ